MSYHQGRIEKLLEWMESQRVDLSIITSPANVMYLTGYYGDPHERWMGVIVLRQGEPFLYVPALDREKAVASSALPVHTHDDMDDAVERLVRLLDCGAHLIKRVAVEKSHLTVARLEGLQAHFAGAQYINVEERLGEMRLQKDAHEIALMRRAARLADEAIALAASRIAPGRREYEIVQAVESFVKQQGADRMAFETTVLAGENSALPHGTSGAREIRRGDLVLIDLGIVWQGYCSDITRTFAVGEANDRQRAIYEAVRKANEAAIAAVKPGVTAAMVDRTAREVIAAAGFGQFFVHRVGHGLGIEIHEPPSLHGNNPQPLLPGTVFTIEPGIYLANVGGVRIEDDVAVTGEGAEVLTTYPKELQILPV